MCLLKNISYMIFAAKYSYNDNETLAGLFNSLERAKEKHILDIMNLFFDNSISIKYYMSFLAHAPYKYHSLIAYTIAEFVQERYRTRMTWHFKWAEYCISLIASLEPSSIDTKHALLFSEFLQNSVKRDAHIIHINDITLFASRITHNSHMNIWLVLGAMVVAYRNMQYFPKDIINNELLHGALTNVSQCITKISNCQSMSCAIVTFVTLHCLAKTKCDMYEKVKAWRHVQFHCLDFK